MKKVVEAIENTLAIVGASLGIWLFISWIDVILNRPYIANWNIFELLF